jgi:hypothetical protein
MTESSISSASETQLRAASWRGFTLGLSFAFLVSASRSLLAVVELGVGWTMNSIGALSILAVVMSVAAVCATVALAVGLPYLLKAGQGRPGIVAVIVAALFVLLFSPFVGSAASAARNIVIFRQYGSVAADSLLMETYISTAEFSIVTVVQYALLAVGLFGWYRAATIISPDDRD